MSDSAAALAEVLDDFEAEQRDLEAVLSSLGDEEWSRPTPAAGWDVRDQTAHLADTEEWAHDTAAGGPRALGRLIERYPSADDLVMAGVHRGREMSGPEVRAWWSEAANRNRAALRSLPRDTRVPWGLGMSLRAFGAARLMEHWAHGLDVREATGRPVDDTPRLRHVAWLGVRALPYAFGVDGVEPPLGRSLRFELEGAGGPWTYGPGDATDVVSGPMGEWCRVAVQRLPARDARGLKGSGPLADMALEHARAFL